MEDMMRNFRTSRSRLQAVATALTLLGLLATGGAALAFESPAFDRGCREMGYRDWDGAIISFGEAIGFDQTNYKAYFKRGQCFYNMNNFNDAINDFSHIIEMDKNNVDAFLWRGTANSRIGKHDEAVRDYLVAIRLNPDLAKRYVEGNGDQVKAVDGNKAGRNADGETRNMGARSTSNGGAVDDYKRAMSLYTSQKNTDELPTSANLGGNDVEQSTQSDSGPGRSAEKRNNRRNRVGSWETTGQSEVDQSLTKSQIRGRIEKLNSAIEADERNANLYFRRAMLYERMQNYDQSVSDLGQAIGLNPRDARYYIARARVYHHQDQPDLEQGDIAKARSVDPTIPAHIRFVNGQQTPQRENKDFKTPVE
jgi:tetratricopeptide (TPR) repeat protein